MMKRFRYILANWIAGDELARLKTAGTAKKFWRGYAIKEKLRRQSYSKANANALGLIERMEGVIKDREAAMRDLIWAKQAREAALQQIIACDTPGGNGTVKRMVRIAREGLE